MAGQVGVLPVPVILAAVDGDESSLAAVAAHFRGTSGGSPPGF